jgi:putative phage-type endonuclease
MLVQGTKEWLDVRKKHIGASDAPCIMGVGFKTPRRLWEEKLGLYEQPVNSAMRAGTQSEPIARALFEKKTGHVVFPTVVFKEEPGLPLMASLDGMDIEREVLVELKRANSADHAIAINGGVPEKYIPQLQHQLYCCDLGWGFYASYDGHDIVIVEVGRDDGYIATMLEKEREFWSRVVANRWPESDELKALVSRYFELKRYEKEMKEVSEQIKALTGGSTVEGEGFRIATRVQKGRIAYDEIPELMGVDVEGYRKEDITVTTILKV